MNKTELITYLRKPNQLTPQQLDELEGIVSEHPYFLSARLLLAKASKESKHPKTKKRVASAAIYSTDRILLKKYLSSDLFFLKEVPKPEEEENTPPKTSDSKQQVGREKIEIKQKPETLIPETSKDVSQPGKETPSKEEKTNRVNPTVKEREKKTKPQPEVPDLPSGQLDSILDELKRDMDNLKSSREKFAQVQEKIVEDDAVSEALKKAEHKTDEPADDKVVSETTDSVIEAKEEVVENIVEVAEKAEEIADPPTESVVETKGGEIDSIKAEESDEQEEEAKQKAIAITRAIIEKAKSEVQEEEADKAKDKEVAEKVSSQEKEVEPETDLVTSEGDASEEVRESDPPSNNQGTSERDLNEEGDSERAERSIREPRFSRFEKRSFLAPPEDFDTSFLDDDGEKDKKEESKSEKAIEKAVEEKKESSTKEEGDQKGKIKLPDLSKAKPVQRKSKRKTEKEKEENEVKDLSGKESKTSDTPKKEETKKESTAKKEETSKKDTTAKKESSAKKASTSSKKETKTKSSKKEPATAAAKKKAEPKKTTTKKVTAAKTSSTKKATSTKKESTTKKTAKPKSTKTKSTKKDDKKDDGKSDRKSQSEIINKFIKESPSIKYQRQEETISEDLSEHSGEWDTNLASEYLAEIYLNQGNKKRAIQIYEALILNYPEKKSYFADLISKIE